MHESMQDGLEGLARDVLALLARGRCQLCGVDWEDHVECAVSARNAAIFAASFESTTRLLLGAARDVRGPAPMAWGRAALLLAAWRCRAVSRQAEVMATESVDEKADAVLVEGRLKVVRVDGEIIAALCESSSGHELYSVGYQGNGFWYCSCPARQTCAHLIALQRVTT